MAAVPDRKQRENGDAHSDCNVITAEPSFCSHFAVGHRNVLLDLSLIL